MTLDCSQQKVFVEYIMLDGVNDHEQHAHQLGKLLVTFKVVSLSSKILFAVHFWNWLTSYGHLMKSICLFEQAQKWKKVVTFWYAVMYWLKKPLQDMKNISSEIWIFWLHKLDFIV